MRRLLKEQTVTNLKERDTISYKEARRRDAPKGVSKKVSLLRTNR
jgi:hypothetical protein